MILFQEDFATQRAIVDYDTRNMSFIKMAVLLKRMGVENNMFFLALTQPELKGVDPHSKNLSPELQLRIGLECKINPWYYLREVVRVGSAGSGGIPYILNRANLAQAWCAFNCLNTFLTMPRQIGKTIGSVGLASWVIFFAGNHITFALFAKGAKLVHENVARLKDMRDNLPPYLLELSISDENNKEGISYTALATKYLTFTAQKDKAAAEDQGRGQSISWEHWDEICYYDNVDRSYPTATSAMDAAKGQCIASGCPAAILITSTAGDIDDPRGRYAFQMVCDAIRFHEKIYDLKNVDEVNNLLRTNSDNRLFYLEYSHLQLGKTQEWFEEKTAGKDPKKIAKDYLNQWLHGSGSNLFPKELIERAVHSVKEPVTSTFYESLMIRWYQDPKQIMADPSLVNKPYLMASDTSDNVGRDYTTFIMIDPFDLSVVCTFRCNSTNMAFVTKCIKKFLSDFPRSIFIPERNKNGAMMLDFLIVMLAADRNFNPFTRIFNTYCQEHDASTPDFRTLDLASGTVRKHFGFTTGANTRDTLYSNVLTTALQLNADRLYDIDLVNEFKGLTKRNGRIDHTVEGHDDLLISYLMCCWFVLFGRNHHMYGIRPDEFMCNITDTGEATDIETKHRMAKMRARGKELLKMIAHAQNAIVRNAYQRELSQIKAYLDEDITDDENKVQGIEQVQASIIGEARAMRTYEPHHLMSVI